MDDQAGVGIDVPGHYRSDPRAEVRALLPPLKAGLKVLEIGCGDGNFCLTLPAVAEAWGIEPYAASAAVARSQLHRVFTSTFEQARDELPLGYFDLVVCNDVIEHMTDAAKFLDEIAVHMAPGSYLVGSVPNVRFSSNLFNLIVARDWHYQNAGILDRTHFRFFTMRSMRRTLEEAGFRVARLEGLNKGAVPGWSTRGSAGAAVPAGVAGGIGRRGAGCRVFTSRLPRIPALTRCRKGVAIAPSLSSSGRAGSGRASPSTAWWCRWWP